MSNASVWPWAWTVTFSGAPTRKTIGVEMMYLLKQEEQAQKEAGIRGEVTEIGWGNQIRSYVMQPYTMVKDHRTNVESGNVGAVMDGDLDPFMNAYLKWVSLSK